MINGLINIRGSGTNKGKSELNMADLFDTTSIKRITLSNRFVRSATGTRMAQNNGGITPQLMKHVMDLVEGGVGLIVSGHAYVLPDGQASPHQLGITAML